MLRVEAKLPGFGGFYVDSVGDLLVWQRGAQLQPKAAIRRLLDEAYSSRREDAVRAQWATIHGVTVSEAQYALSELVSYQEMVSHSPIPLPGVLGAGVRLASNRLLVDFVSYATLARGLSALARLGVPTEAIEARDSDPVQVSTTTWSSYIRPSRGGIKLQIFHPTLHPDSVEVFSHGFNVRTRTPLTLAHYFSLPSHSANIWYVQNGASGMSVGQPLWNYSFGVVSNNPPWTTDPSQCGTDSTGTAVDFCTRADVALGTFTGSNGERKLALSATGGVNGAVGSQDLNPTYRPVEDAVPASLIFNGANRAHKSGQRTGTTSGQILTDCYDSTVTIPWGAGTRRLKLQCAIVVDHIGWGGGDSGAPVFGQDVAGGPYKALGIQIGGSGTTYPAGHPSAGICMVGVLCRVVAHPWAAVETRLSTFVTPATI